jgi:hypothetical protein
MNGAAIITEREYSSGSFEFKFLPSLAEGVFTAVGLSNDGTNSSNPFLNILFNLDNYGLDTFGIQIGGVPNLFGED